LKTLTQKEKHNKIFDQLVYELFCEPLPKWTKETKHKSPGGLQKKNAFNQKMKEQAINDPGEI